MPRGRSANRFTTAVELLAPGFCVIRLGHQRITHRGQAMTPVIIVPDDPLPEHRDAIAHLLDAYNDARSGMPDPVAPLALLLRAADSEAIVGGLWGVSYWRWLFVDQLFVPQAHRGQGLGTALLQQAETKARERGCIGIWLLSFSFQAPGFYRRQGYSEFGSIEDYPPGHRCAYFFKRLGAASS